MKYVLGFLFDISDASVLLVRKNRPEWQAGLLNGIGGKIEEGEEPLAAMKREFFEETGIKDENIEWNNFLTMKFGDDEKSKMYCYKAFRGNLTGFNSQNDVGELIFCMNILDVLARKDKMENLNWIIPLAWHEPPNTKVKFKEYA